MNSRHELADREAIVDLSARQESGNTGTMKEQEISVS
tara:strand:- start:1551 stop:1661 length:111 start_codon:yes stop_codon:yes gene_type:complete